MSKRSYTDFDYSDVSARETLILRLLQESKNERSRYEHEWAVNDAFYDGFHNRVTEAGQQFEDAEDGDAREFYKSLVLTDPYIQVESQIDPNTPVPAFYGRDQQLDEVKAKQREFVVKYVLNNNNFKAMSTSVRRSVLKYGNGFVKAYWSDGMTDERGEYNGDISISHVKIDDLFPDPSATCLQECEYINYVYYLHIKKVKRIFGGDLKKRKIDDDELLTVLPSDTRTVSDTQQESRDNEVQVIEHWYRDEDGDIACSVLLGNREVKHIPKYWDNTRSQNKLYPFVHFYRVKDERRFWAKSELTVIRPLVMAGDRILQSAMQNFDLMANDAILMEENSLTENTVLTNEPGAVWEYKHGSNPPARVGGLSNMSDAWASIAAIQAQIERTLRNFETNQGKEATRTTTASGLAQIRADAQTQMKVKEYDMAQAYRDFFELIDWLGLEYYTTDKMIFIGVPGAKNNTEGMDMNADPAQGDVFFSFNASNMRITGEDVTLLDPDTPEVSKYSYFPRVDCTVVASNEIERSKSFTVSVLQALMSTQVTPDNYKIAIKLIEELEIQGGQEIIDDYKTKYEPQISMPEGLQQMIAMLPPEEQALWQGNPALALSVYASALEQQLMGQGQGQMPGMPPQTVNNAGIAQTSPAIG